MRVGIDGHFVTRLPRRGIGTYSLNFITAVTKAYPKVNFYIYIRYDDFDNSLPNLPNVTIRHIKSFSDVMWEQVLVPLSIRNDNLDIFHSLGNTAPLLLPRGVHLVLSLMDVMFLKSGRLIPLPTNFNQKMSRIYRRLVAPLAAFKSNYIITISNYSKKDILELISQKLRNKIEVIYLSCESSFSPSGSDVNSDILPLKLSSITSEYILCLGADDPRKNTLRIIKAFTHLVNTTNFNYDLVVVGYKNWESSNCYREVLNTNLVSRIHFFPYVNTTSLAFLYRNAKLFLYPSLYGGFGIPLLEAFNSGCPVIASGTTSIPEVGSDAVHYVDPNSINDLSSSILFLVKNPNLLLEMKMRGFDRAKNFSWTNVASQTMEVYCKCINKN